MTRAIMKGKEAKSTTRERNLEVRGALMSEIAVMQSVFMRNESLADKLNKKLSEKKIFCVNVMGSPGAGKTSTIVRLIGALDKKSYVIEGDLQSDIDTQKLIRLGIAAVQINTGTGCHLDVPQIEDAAEKLKSAPGCLFIENIGNLVCPAEFMIGEHIKLLIASVTEGSDKPYKYPPAFEKADILLINKYDLAKYVNFDEEYFMTGVNRLNPSLKVFKVSAETGEGFADVADELNKRYNHVLEGVVI
jgi:hydrogenase nickel incorporation protein HypB